MSGDLLLQNCFSWTEFITLGIYEASPYLGKSDRLLMSGIIGGFSIALIASLFAGLDVLRKRKRKLLLLGLFLTIGLVLTFMLNPSEALLIMIILGLVLLPSLLMKKRDDERPDKEIFLKSFQLGVIIIISLNIVGLIL